MRDIFTLGEMTGHFMSPLECAVEIAKAEGRPPPDPSLVERHAALGEFDEPERPKKMWSVDILKDGTPVKECYGDSYAEVKKHAIDLINQMNNQNN